TVHGPIRPIQPLVPVKFGLEVQSRQAPIVFSRVKVPLSPIHPLSRRRVTPLSVLKLAITNSCCSLSGLAGGAFCATSACATKNRIRTIFFTAGLFYSRSLSAEEIFPVGADAESLVRKRKSI